MDVAHCKKTNEAHIAVYSLLDPTETLDEKAERKIHNVVVRQMRVCPRSPLQPVPPDSQHSA